MKENLKVLSLVVIAISVFTIALLDILKLTMPMHAESEMPEPVAYTKPEKEDTAHYPLTTVKFEEEKFDFGTINEGDRVTHSFGFENTGDNPLVITQARGSCGCTVPTYPKEPIPPGGKGVISVEFNSEGKPGKQNKFVFVTANTEPAGSRLSIMAQVNEK